MGDGEVVERRGEGIGGKERGGKEGEEEERVTEEGVQGRGRRGEIWREGYVGEGVKERERTWIKEARGVGSHYQSLSDFAVYSLATSRRHLTRTPTSRTSCLTTSSRQQSSVAR